MTSVHVTVTLYEWPLSALSAGLQEPSIQAVSLAQGTVQFFRTGLFWEEMTPGSFRAFSGRTLAYHPPLPKGT